MWAKQGLYYVLIFTAIKFFPVSIALNIFRPLSPQGPSQIFTAVHSFKNKIIFFRHRHITRVRIAYFKVNIR